MEAWDKPVAATASEPVVLATQVGPLVYATPVALEDAGMGSLSSGPTLPLLPGALQGIRISGLFTRSETDADWLIQFWPVAAGA